MTDTLPGYAEHDLEMVLTYVETVARHDPDSVNIGDLQAINTRLANLINGLLNGTVGREAA